MKLSKKRLERLLTLVKDYLVGAELKYGWNEELQSDQKLLADARQALLGPEKPKKTPSQRGRAAREKGIRRELAWNRFLRDQGLFPEVKRGWQARDGGKREGDSIHTEPIHFETKGGEYASPYASLEQAWRDACARYGEEEVRSHRIFVVVPHKRNNMPWLVWMYAEQWAELVRRSDLLDQPKRTGFVAAGDILWYDPKTRTYSWANPKSLEPGVVAGQEGIEPSPGLSR
jgi:hypothetical protein